jgi:hypothetical protein
LLDVSLQIFTAIVAHRFKISQQLAVAALALSCLLLLSNLYLLFKVRPDAICPFFFRMFLPKPTHVHAIFHFATELQHCRFANLLITMIKSRKS